MQRCECGKGLSLHDGQVIALMRAVRDVSRTELGEMVGYTKGQIETFESKARLSPEMKHKLTEPLVDKRNLFHHGPILVPPVTNINENGTPSWYQGSPLCGCEKCASQRKKQKDVCNYEQEGSEGD